MVNYRLLLLFNNIIYDVLIFLFPLIRAKK